MFEQRVYVHGRVIGGQIIKGEFHVNNFGVSVTHPPIPTRILNKSDVDSLIDELQQVREKM